MQLAQINDIRLTERNKALGKAVLIVDGQSFWADFIFYLQGLDCLGIRLGRHDPFLNTRELEQFILQHKVDICSSIKTDILGIRKNAKGESLQD